MFSIASVGVSGLTLLEPMLDDAAAPDIAMAVAKSSSSTSRSNSSVRAYFVAWLPMNFGLKMKNSAFRPRRFAYFEPWMFKAVLMRWYGVWAHEILLNLKRSMGASSQFSYFIDASAT